MHDDEHERIIAALQADACRGGRGTELHHLEAAAGRADLQASPTPSDTADIRKLYAERRGLLTGAVR
jgi:hypothetical protein